MLMAQRKLQYEEPYVYQYDEIPGAGMSKARKTAAPSRKVSKVQKLRFQSLVIMLVVIGIFGLIGAKTVHTTIVKGAEIKGLETEIQALRVENDLLQVEADKLRSVARIEKVALAMGMEKPEGTIYIASNLIQAEKTVGVEQNQKTAAVPVEGKANSVFDNVFRIFTSFFASTQR
jgi:cell division protein FtsL